MNLKDYIKNNIGLRGFTHSKKTKIFYPSKPRSCVGCEFYTLRKSGCFIGSSYLEVEKPYCIADFNIENSKPQERCYPIKGENGAGNLYEYHADVVLQQIIKLRKNEI